MQPETRELIDGCLRACIKLRDDVDAYVQIDLPEPDDDLVSKVRLLIEKVAHG